MSNAIRIAVIAGDGIGKEVVPEGRTANCEAEPQLKALVDRHRVELHAAPAGNKGRFKLAKRPALRAA